MTKNNTKTDVDKSLFVFVKDSNTGRVKRIAIPSDVQIGVKDNPSELQLLGRFSIANKEFTVDNVNKGTINLSNHDTISLIALSATPPSGRITVNLPSNPRNGQLHFVKDSSGTSSTVPIDIYANGALIDNEFIKTLSIDYESMLFCWFKQSWNVLIFVDNFTTELSTVYTYSPTLASIVAASGVFLRGSTTGGVLITPGADNSPVLLTATNADGTTLKPIGITGTSANYDVTTSYKRTSSGSLSITEALSANGICSVNVVVSSSYEIQHNGTPRITVDSAGISLAGTIRSEHVIHTGSANLIYGKINYLTTGSLFTLPLLSASNGFTVSVTVINETTGTVIISRSGSNQISGGTTSTSYNLTTSPGIVTFNDRASFVWSAVPRL